MRAPPVLLTRLAVLLTGLGVLLCALPASPREPTGRISAGPSRLEVEVRAGSATVRATAIVQRAGAPAEGPREAPSGPRGVRASSSGTDDLGLAIVLALCFLAFGSVIPAVAVLRRSPRPEWARQIDQYQPRGSGEGGESAGGSLLRTALGLSQRMVRRGTLEERMAHDLDRAGMALRPHEWALVRGGVAIALVAVLSLATGELIFGVLAGGTGAWGGTRIFITSKIAHRISAFSDRLPDALQLVAGSLRSGFSVPQALGRLAEQDNHPLGGEMARALAETRIGVCVEDALDKVAERMDCRDLFWVVMAVRIQREVGGNLADVIDTTVETMRERTRLRRHVRALSAEGRLSAYVLIALPFATAGVLFLGRPEYVSLLYTDPAGLLMLGAGGLFMSLGWFWMSRLMKVET